MKRVQSISSHLTSNSNIFSNRETKNHDDVVICSALRTCLSKANRGPLKDSPPELLISEVTKAIIKQTKVDPKLIEDFIIGNVLIQGAGAVQARASELMSGIPLESSAVAINRLCSSGIESISMLASKIKSGIIDCGIAGGVEQMSMWKLPPGRYPKISEEAKKHDLIQKMYVPDGMTSENVVEKYGMTRVMLDEFAMNSNLKAAKAQKEGKFVNEIVPIRAKVLDKEGNEKFEMADTDNGIRANSTMASLAKLKPAFKKDGTTTGGNSSQLTDGAACVLMARRSVAEKNGLPILAKFVGYSTVGVSPEIMGVGPGYAIPKCLAKAGLKIEDIDVYEINEAFASQARWSVEHLKIDPKKVNPNGGAIALGHPLAATGARMVCTLLGE